MNKNKKARQVEILAPAGSFESLVAGVRCGANAIYLGSDQFSARHGAKNFDKTQLEEAVSYSHARNVKVHLALNTIIFDDELKDTEAVIKEAAQAGVDAFIIQDLAVAELVSKTTKGIEMHGSTQMAVHNLDGVLQLAELGFTRVVLARELTMQEIEYIAKNSPIDVECFIHGALCMSVSGQCYISSMIGGRSGNRGRCAQTCRLPFKSADDRSHALSLKDLSVIEALPALSELGVSSFKIEGRLKRPEYVAAAVTACKDVLGGKKPDYEILQNVFSRSGFTQGYIEDDMGDEMFGTRSREDVNAVSGSLKELAGLYYQEQPLVAVDFEFTMQADKPSTLKATTEKVSVTVEGDVPQTAKTMPTDAQRAEKSLQKTGNTPFYVENFSYNLDDGIMLPASALNALRRDVLEKLLEELEVATPKEFTPYEWSETAEKGVVVNQKLRVRLESSKQLSNYIAYNCDEIILSVYEIDELPPQVLEDIKGKLIAELPRMAFRLSSQEQLKGSLSSIKNKGVTDAIAAELGGIHLAKSMGFTVHGDFSLNAVNNIAVSEYGKMGIADITMSIEYALSPNEPASDIPKGLIAYGNVPLMIFRNHPAGLAEDEGILTDRLNIEFPVKKQGDISVLYNSVPIFWADQLRDLNKFDFLTIYFTGESSEECDQVFSKYKNGGKLRDKLTRGLYLRRID